MGIEARLQRLERVQPPSDCRCGPPRVVFVGDWREPGERPDAGPEVCPNCGRPRVTVAIEYVVDWRGGLG